MFGSCRCPINKVHRESESGRSICATHAWLPSPLRFWRLLSSHTWWSGFRWWGNQGNSPTSIQEVDIRTRTNTQGSVRPAPTGLSGAADVINLLCWPATMKTTAAQASRVECSSTSVLSQLHCAITASHSWDRCIFSCTFTSPICLVLTSQTGYPGNCPSPLSEILLYCRQIHAVQHPTHDLSHPSADKRGCFSVCSLFRVLVRLCLLVISVGMVNTRSSQLGLQQPTEFCLSSPISSPCDWIWLCGWA